GEVERPARHAPRLLPIEEFQHLHLGLDAREVELHPRPVDHPAAVGEARLARPRADVVEDAVDEADGAERDPFVVQLRRDEPPAAVHLPDEGVGRHADVLVVGRVRAHVAHRRERRDLVAGRARADDEHRDALVLRGIGVRPRGKPDVVVELRLAGEELAPVDDPMIAVADGARPERGEVRARRRLGVADREVTLAAEDGRKVLRLLLRAAVLHDRGGDGIDRQHRQHDAGARRLVEEDELLDRGAPLAAVLLWPADAEPAVGAQPPDRLMIKRAAPFGGRELRLILGRHEAGKIFSELVAERLLLRSVLEMHPRSSSGRRYLVRAHRPVDRTYPPTTGRSTPTNTGELARSMKRRSSSSRTSLARCHAASPRNPSKSSRLSHQSSATPSYGSGPPRLARRAFWMGCSIVCSCTYRRIRSTAACCRTSGPWVSHQYVWKSARERCMSRRAQKTSLTMMWPSNE